MKKENNAHEWTAEDDAVVAKMLMQKKSSQQIANVLGLSRRSVSSRVYRVKELAEIGFTGRKTPTRKTEPKRRVLPVSPSIFNEPPASVAYEPIYSADRATVGVPMMLIGACMCKWPVNDAAKGELHLFCGAAADGPYCREHTEKSIGRGTEGERTADRILAKAA